MDTKVRELAEKDHSLEHVRRQKDATDQRLKHLRQTFKQTQAKKIKLVREKMEVEKQLELKEQQLQFQHTIHQKDNEIQNKEISELQQRLHKIKCELSSERKVAQDLREKLQKATIELENESALAHKAEKEAKILKTSLKREREAVDFLKKQHTSVSTSKDQYIKEVKVRRH